MKRLILAGILSGCAASTTNVGTLTLPTSKRIVDVVQHRSDSKECAVGWVIQVYDEKGTLIDSKSGHGNEVLVVGRARAPWVRLALRSATRRIKGKAKGRHKVSTKVRIRSRAIATTSITGMASKEKELKL